MGELQHAAVVDKLMWVSFVFIEEVVFVVLVLEGDEGMADEVGEVEEETIVRCVLIVEHYPAIVYELYLLGDGRKPILVFALPYLVDQLGALLLLAALLLD